MNDKTTTTREAEAPVSEALRALPQVAPPPGLTKRIGALVDETASKPGGGSAPHTGRWFALAASAAFAVWVALPRLAPEPAVTADPAALSAEAGAIEPDAANIDALMAESQFLESVLNAVPRRGRVQRVGTASTITALEDRVAFIDAQLSAPELAADVSGREVLWRERVGLMNTLVSLQAPPARMVAL